MLCGNDHSIVSSRLKRRGKHSWKYDGDYFTSSTKLYANPSICSTAKIVLDKAGMKKTRFYKYIAPAAYHCISASSSKQSEHQAINLYLNKTINAVLSHVINTPKTHEKAKRRSAYLLVLK